ncbi:MAG: lipopolysaccharide assembly protein LapB [Gammaproteobacteria bacterium]|nr:MAG: lipopolysaccharide assembly protein LapB [Gammaproteobacteria bacterium]
MIELLWLLLPVAAASGWYAARRSARSGEDDLPPKALRSHYFKGINYLLNEQPDKAIEVFIKVLEVDSETVETHLALGNLYRRRGEVDRAIRIHQNLIARPTLSPEQRQEALLELGQDYMSAGLLDRAENLFQELAEESTHTVQALRQLIDIYEQEKDWDKAIETSRRLESVTGNQLSRVIAHYQCEQAEVLQEGGEEEGALRTARAALATHAGCVRATLLEGDLLAARSDWKSAIETYRRVEDQDPDFVPESIERLKDCYRQAGNLPEMSEYLRLLLERRGGITPTLALAEVLKEQEGEEAAIDFLTEHLSKRASVRGLDRLLEIELKKNPSDGARLQMLKQLTNKLLEDRPVYKCLHCGFPGKSMHWQCPGCKHWNSVKPIHGVEGE